MTMTKICCVVLAAAVATIGAVDGGPDDEKTAAPSTAKHCQIPCGIYGDKMRIDMIMEDAATIEKGMKQITKLGGQGSVNFNQVVRWTMNKDDHAGKIQENVAAYWLAQRIKAPDGSDDGAKDTYQTQLELMHGITVAAMKCKQTTDTSWPDKVRDLTMRFSKTYFSKEDLEHLEGHHGSHGK